MAEHTIVQGECLLSVADQYGFFWETLWEHPKNAALKRERKDPAILFPGDVIFIPEKRQKTETRSTGSPHRFRVKNVPAKLLLRLLDDDDSPRANLDYVLVVDGKEFKGKTDGNGALSLSILPGAKTGLLTLTSEGEEEVYELSLGHLDPIEEVSGVQSRLHGLGYYEGEVDGVTGPETEQALKDFQAAYEMEITGKLDDSLRNKLKSIYGS